jgi:eukaryotic-like serine/threonine-protein kinase
VAEVLHDLNAGAEISGRYRLERPLGSGATAAVWQARDLDLGRTVALKLLLGDGVAPELAARFEREASILGRLSHPNVVPVLGTGTHGGRPYLVMELVDGESLQHVLRRGPMDVDAAVELVAEIASGLAAAHAAGVVHRDVKPANILCPTSGSPRLVDFGIARVDDLTSITGTHFVIGTASYLSPEQARGEVPRPASDVYSLGCVLFEALTGEPPFGGDTAVAVAYRHVHEPPRSPLELRPEITPAVAAVVERCLAKEVSMRYPSGVELEAALRGAILGSNQTDEPATTSLIAPVRDATMVMPPVAPDAELIDPSPLAPVEEPDRRWIVVAGLAAATIVLLVVLALPLAAGSDTDSRGSTTESTFRPPPSLATTTTLPATTVAPAPKGGKGHGHKGHD